MTGSLIGSLREGDEDIFEDGRDGAQVVDAALLALYF
jgi:hypothetical protein